MIFYRNISEKYKNRLKFTQNSKKFTRIGICKCLEDIGVSTYNELHFKKYLKFKKFEGKGLLRVNKKKEHDFSRNRRTNN
jgi:hypothetical protein